MNLYIFSASICSLKNILKKRRYIHLYYRQSCTQQRSPIGVIIPNILFETMLCADNVFLSKILFMIMRQKYIYFYLLVAK